MGQLVYAGSVRVEFEDRLLAHLQLVIGAKIRRGESFHFSWRDDPSAGDGRTIVWVNPSVSIAYRFGTSAAPRINRAWLDALTHAANSPAGLHILPEPSEPAAPEPALAGAGAGGRARRS
jgi:hypothetical protein